MKALSMAGPESTHRRIPGADESLAVPVPCRLVSVRTLDMNAQVHVRVHFHGLSIFRPWGGVLVADYFVEEFSKLRPSVYGGRVRVFTLSGKDPACCALVWISCGRRR